MFPLLFLFHLFIESTAFLFLGGSGGCCGSAPPAPPPPICPMALPPPACPPAPACLPPSLPCQGPVARGTKIDEKPQALGLPDEMELRAAAFGIQLDNRSDKSAVFEALHKLGDLKEKENQAINSGNSKDVSTEDRDLYAVQMGKSSEIRRAPIKMMEESTTAASIQSSTVRVEETTELIEPKCNSQVLKKLIIDSMTESSSESKKKINLAAEEKFGGNVDVVCSRGHFSYVFSSNLYCEATKGLMTCIAYRQAS